jgi:carbonic anhydrase/acetyltransferase-like protein (isoleucine patch superfamily)
MINSSLQALLVDSTFNLSKLSGAVELSENITITSMPWGLFELITIDAKWNSKSQKKAFLLGQSFKDATDSLVLRLPKLNSPLICAGNSTINGRIRIPIEGLKPGYVDGAYFTGNIEGAISDGVSTDSLPRPSSKFKNSLSKLFNIQSLALTYSISPIVASGFPDSLSVPFVDEGVIYFFSNAIEINRCSIKGKVVVFSTATITIGSNCSVSDALIIAPKVIVSDHFSGNIQIFATDSVAIGSNVSLLYPSVVLLNQQTANRSATISVGRNSFIDGAIVATSPQGIPYYFLPKVFISSETTIRGLCYIQGLTDLRGQVFGSSMVEHFYCETYSGFYLNYLYGGGINNMDTPFNYSTPFIFENQWKKCLVESF